MNYMETDVFITADDQVVCFHDRTLSRLCNRPGESISDYNFADLPAIQNTVALDDRDETYTQTADDDGQFLKLGDLFDAMPSSAIYSIDLKFSDASKVDLVYNEIASRNYEDRVIWGSKYGDVHARAIELDP